MYSFVFLWIPALAPRGEGIPHGLIFALFMLSCMAGATIGGHLLSRNYSPEYYLQWVFLVATLSMFVPAAYYSCMEPMSTPVQNVRGVAPAGKALLLAFCTFEVCVGVFWPSMMSLRAKHLPDELRTTLMNYFRIPLNLFVCVVLYSSQIVPLSGLFGLCGMCLILALWGCQLLEAAVAEDGLSSSK